MLFKKKNLKKSIPEGFSAADIKVQSSICNGEKAIGFYNPSDGRLYYAELVRTEEDIRQYYRKYGIEI